MKRAALSLALLAIAFQFAGPSFAEPAAEMQPCRQEEFEAARYVVCTVDPAGADLRLFWKNASDRPYRRFGNIADALEENGQTLAFALNAGMYGSDYTPVGLYVEDGAELRPADTSSVEGPPARVPNFYKKPNGIFFLDGEGAGILTTGDYLAAQPEPRFATQSGPMLVIEGALHPALISGSTDRTRRSGVGVSRDGTVHFAVSEGQVNFHEFARLFRDALDCPDALFLDGGRGVGLYSPEMGYNDSSWYGGYGPIFGLVR